MVPSTAPVPIGAQSPQPRTSAQCPPGTQIVYTREPFEGQRYSDSETRDTIILLFHNKHLLKKKKHRKRPGNY